MKPVDQTIPGPPTGDCFRACIASILELPIEDCPNPHPPEFHWWEAWNEWLLPRGLQLVEWDVPNEKVWCPLAGYWIATIPSLNLPANPERPSLGRHCVVMRGGEIAHDPSMGRKRGPTEWRQDDAIFQATLLVPLDPVVSASEGEGTPGA